MSQYLTIGVKIFEKYQTIYHIMEVFALVIQPKMNNLILKKWKVVKVFKNIVFILK